MKKIKLFLCVALFGAMSFGAFSAYEHYTMSEEERALLKNVEALTSNEGGSSGMWDCFAVTNNCWFWNCSTVNRCENNCYSVSADEWSNPGKCFKN